MAACGGKWQHQSCQSLVSLDIIVALGNASVADVIGFEWERYVIWILVAEFHILGLFFLHDVVAREWAVVRHKDYQVRIGTGVNASHLGSHS